jgi:DNA polymerase-1
MPEDLSSALPDVRRLLDAFHIPVLSCDGFEADDLIGTLVRRAEKEGFTSYMVTPDKDFGQLIDEHTFLYKPGRMGSDVEILGLPEIQKRWSIQRPEQVIDVLALMGDSTDNVPGVPGVGEKTAIKLIGQFGTVENLLARSGELTGKLRENVENNREQALLSKRLVTLICDAPCPFELESLTLKPRDDEKLKAFLIEFEFNSIGKRLFGDDFKAGRGYQETRATPAPQAQASPATGPRQSTSASDTEELVLIGEAEERQPELQAAANLKHLADIPHTYRLTCTASERASLVRELQRRPMISFHLLATSPEPKEAAIVGIAFSTEPHAGWYVPLNEDSSLPGVAPAALEDFRPIFESEKIEKVGHNLKFDLTVLEWHGLTVRGRLFDTMVAHSLIEPDMRHSLDYIAEAYLGYTSLALASIVGEKMERSRIGELSAEKLVDYAAERADLALQLRASLEPQLKEKGQEQVFYEIEAPLVPVLAYMEFEGIKVDAAALADFATQLAKEIDELEKTICRLAGTTFNLNSPRQLGQILFEVMKICEAPKKTKTGQYATDEQTLMVLAPDHEIVQRLLEHRAATKLKSTYADALPAAIWPKTGRIHTTFNQVMTSTGRLNSQNPNLQNIPIRRERGQEIRRAFVPRDRNYLLLSADYSQIELRIIAALSREAGLLEAFKTGVDVHTATAARVFGVPLDGVNAEMRRKAKMVNYGIAYGISAFGLSQRLGIPRKEAAGIIDEYFRQFAGIRRYMSDTIAFAREHGFVKTVTGRRRYMRDIRSSNNTIRSGAERNAINAPIQGSAADLIKLAMVNIHREFQARKLKTRMLLQVHDELVFDLYRPEEQEVRALVEEKMKTAIPLDVPMVVEMGVGENWLAAH